MSDTSQAGHRTSPPPELPGEFRVPNLVGLTLDQAASILPDRSLNDRRLVVTAEAIDAYSPTETVLDQTPSPGTTALEVQVTIAVPPAQPCQLDQMTLTYRGGEEGAGNDFGGIAIRDTSPTWCVLNGPITLAGLNSNGQPDTQTETVQVPIPIALSPNAPAPTPHQIPAIADIEAGIDLYAEYRDGPQQDGRCHMQVRPARWSVKFTTGTKTVNDYDPTDTGLTSFITCRGRIHQSPPIRLTPN